MPNNEEGYYKGAATTAAAAGAVAVGASAAGGTAAAAGAAAATGIGVPLAIALGALAAIQFGIGIFKARKGKKMEEAAAEDRERYLGRYDELLAGRRKEHEGWGDIIRGGIPGREGIPTIAGASYDSLKKGQGKISGQLSGYADTLGKATSRISETDLMKKKFGLR